MMHIFDKFTQIQSYSYKEIFENIKKQRESVICKNFMEMEPQNYNLDELYSCKDIPEKFNIFINNWQFSCLFNFINTKKLYIIFSGYKNKKDPLPLFKRWSWNMAFDGSVLYISDPMLMHFKELSLGWYYGLKDDNIYIHIKNIIDILNFKFNFAHNIFYGSSGGGFAALQASTYMENSFAIAINPQIDIKNFSYTSTFIQITGINLHDDDKHDRNNLLKRLQNSKSKFLIMQNDTDSVHVSNHLLPLMKIYGAYPQYGIQQIKNWFAWVYHAYGNHNAQEDKIILQFILFIVDNIINNRMLTGEMKNTSIALNELWAQLYWLKHCINEKKSSSS